MSWTDNKIDDLYRKSANGLSFEYKEKYWDEISSQIPASNIAPIIDSDAQIDQMYQASASETTFTYKPEYWQSMEAMLPQQRRPDFLWFFASLLFLGFFGTAPFISSSLDIDSATKMASTEESFEKNKDVEKDNAQSSDVKENVTENVKVESLNSTFVLDPIQLPFNSMPYLMPTYGNDEMFYSPGDNNSWMNHINANLPENSSLVDGQNDDGKGDVDLLAIRPMAEENLGELVDYPIMPNKVKSTVVGYVQGFGGLSQSLITPSESITHSYGIGLGIEVQNRNLSISAGVNGLISNHNDLVLNRTAKVYGFGSDVHQFKIDYQQLYTVEGNLELGYAFNKHKVKVGVRPSYTFSSRVRVQESGENMVQGDVHKTAADRSVYGYMGGLNRFGVKPMIGYAYRITPTIELGVNLGMQLMPMVNEDFIDGINNKLPIDGQLYFKKTISFK